MKQYWEEDEEPVPGVVIRKSGEGELARLVTEKSMDEKMTSVGKIWDDNNNNNYCYCYYY